MKIYLEKRVPYIDYSGEVVYTMTRPITLKELLRELEMEQHIAMVNGKYKSGEYILQDNDRVIILPVMTGG